MTKMVSNVLWPSALGKAKRDAEGRRSTHAEVIKAKTDLQSGKTDVCQRSHRSTDLDSAHRSSQKGKCEERSRHDAVSSSSKHDSGQSLRLPSQDKSKEPSSSTTRHEFSFVLEDGRHVRFECTDEWKAVLQESANDSDNKTSFRVACEIDDIEEAIRQLEDATPLQRQQRLHFKPDDNLVYISSGKLIDEDAESQAQSSRHSEKESTDERKEISTQERSSALEIKIDKPMDRFLDDCILSTCSAAVSDLTECRIRFEGVPTLSLANEISKFTSYEQQKLLRPKNGPSRHDDDGTTDCQPNNKTHARDNSLSLIEYLSTTSIRSIHDLVAAINSSENETESALLMEWASECISAFSEGDLTRMKNDEIKEYFTLSKILVKDDLRRDCLLKWFSSLCDKMDMNHAQDQAIVKLMEITLHRIDERVFEKNPAVLQAFCDKLMSKFQSTEQNMTQQTQRYFCSILHSIRTALLLTRKISQAHCSQDRPDSALVKFTSLLKSVPQMFGSDSITFTAEVIAESLRQYQIEGVNSSHTSSRNDSGNDKRFDDIFVLRNLTTLGLNLDSIEKEHRTWQDAIGVPINGQLQPWYLHYQSLNMHCLLSLRDRRNFEDFEKDIQQLTKKNAKKDHVPRTVVFGSVQLLGLLIMHSSSSDIRIRCMNELVSLRNKFAADRGIVLEVLTTLAEIASYGRRSEQTIAKSTLLQWNQMKPPSRITRFVNVLKRKKKKTLSKKKTAVLRTICNEWLSGNTLDDKIEERRNSCTTIDTPGPAFFSSILAVSKPIKVSDASITVVDKGALRASLSGPPLSNVFQGRTGEVETFQKVFDSTEDLVYAPPIVGKPGVGKTQLACKIVEQQQSAVQYKHTFWIPASSRQSLLEAYIRIAMLLDIKVDDDFDITIECVKSRLKKDLCLYVFEAAPGWDELKDFLPDEKGHVLITSTETRESEWSSGTKPFMLTPMNDEDIRQLSVAFGLAMNDYQRNDNLLAQLKKVATTPLAATQFLSAIVCDRSIEGRDWGKALHKLTDFYENKDPTEDDNGSSVVVRYALDVLKRQSSTEYEAARNLLSQLSLVESRCIPMNWILLWNSEDKSLRKKAARKVVRSLQELSLIIVDDERKQVHIHAETQAAIRKLALRTEASTLVHTLDAFAGDPEHRLIDHSRGVAILSHLRCAHRRLRDTTLSVSHEQKLAHHLSSICRFTRLADESLYWAKIRLECARDKHSQSDHRDVVAALKDTATLLDESGDYKQAWDSWKEAVETTLRLYSELRDVSVAKMLMSFGEYAYDLEKFTDAAKAFEQACDIVKEFPNDEPRLFTQLMNSLADCRSHMGSVQTTLELREDVYRRTQLDYDRPNDSILASTIHNLGVALAKIGTSERAYKMLRRALQMREALHSGRAHEDICHSLHNLSCVADDLGRQHDAGVYSRRAVDMARQLHGIGDHLNSSRALHMRGRSLSQYGMHKEALRCSEEAVRMGYRLFKGQEHPELARYHRTSGLIRLQLGDAKAAKEHLEKAYFMALKIYKQEQHPIVLAYRHWVDKAAASDGAFLMQSAHPTDPTNSTFLSGTNRSYFSVR